MDDITQAEHASAAEPTEPAAAEPAAQPTTEAPVYQRVEYQPPPNTRTPVLKAGKYWHMHSRHLLAPEAVKELEGEPGFTILGPGVPPAPRNP